MSTIASPREGSAPLPRRMNSSQNVTTPTSSAKPSLDVPRSATASPNAPPSNQTAASKRSNRAALREYYNIKKAAGPPTPTLEITPEGGAEGDDSGDGGAAGAFWAGPPSPLAAELDSPGLDAAAFARRALASGGLADVLSLQARVLGEMRALDAERKALVYDNYSKLISATETIRRMRANMDPLNPVASTLDPAIARIYQQASGIRDAARREVQQHGGRIGGAEGEEEKGTKDGEEERATGGVEQNKESSDIAERTARRERTRQLAKEVLGVPGRLRILVAEGRLEEAKKEWELPRRLLETWRAKGLGGPDVEACIREGDAVLTGDGSSGSSGTSRRNSTE